MGHVMNSAVERAGASRQGSEPPGGFARLVPELDVSDLAASLAFWCGLLGFEVAYDRPEAGFAYLHREGAQLMLSQRNGRWDTAPLDRPFGRGINLQIEVGRLDDVLFSLASANWPLFKVPETACYRVGDGERRQREVLVQDPDGYLIRLMEVMG